MADQLTTPGAATSSNRHSTFDHALAAYHRARAEQEAYSADHLIPLNDAHDLLAPGTQEAQATLSKVKEAEDHFDSLTTATHEAAERLLTTPAGSRHHLATKLVVMLHEQWLEDHHNALITSLLLDVRSLDPRPHAALKTVA